MTPGRHPRRPGWQIALDETTMAWRQVRVTSSNRQIVWMLSESVPLYKSAIRGPRASHLLLGAGIFSASSLWLSLRRLLSASNWQAARASRSPTGRPILFADSESASSAPESASLHRSLPVAVPALSRKSDRLPGDRQAQAQ